MNTKQQKVNLSFSLCFVIGVRRVKGLFYGIKFASRHTRKSTLLALHAFAFPEPSFRFVSG